MRFTGEIAGLCAALTWAISSLVFSRAPAPATALNLFKNIVGAVWLLLTLALFAVFGTGDRPLAAVAGGGTELAWLAASAILGIVVGDTCYFRSLQILGARRSLTLATLAPPMAAVLGWAVLEESPSRHAWLGIAITCVGIIWVVRDENLRRDGAGHYPGTQASGVAFGFLAAACQALGAVLSKLGMARFAPLEASFIRLATAAACGILWGAASGRLGPWCASLRRPGLPLRLAAAATCGTYLGIWLSLVAFHRSPVAVATTLTALSPVFVLPLARVFLGFPMTPRAITGVFLAIAGVVLLFDGA